MHARLLASFGCGLLFGLGLAMAQMTDPLKVQAFLDVAGRWDPSLALVMVGAVSVTGLGFRWLRGCPAPSLSDRFHWPTLTRIDTHLLIGASLFGIGWGLTGYCPGPAWATILTGNAQAWLFVPAMVAGAWLQQRTRP